MRSAATWASALLAGTLATVSSAQTRPEVEEIAPPATRAIADAAPETIAPPDPERDERAGASLSLEDVLESVDRFYPTWLALELERERAEGVLLAAQGAFDTRLGATGEAVPKSYYDRYTADLGIEQPTRLWGSRLFGGYRVGRGDFPSYLGGTKTNQGGELRAGVEIPLLKDGATDAARTELRSSELGLQAVDPKIEVARIAIVREASETFWNWVAMGLNVSVEERLLAAAEARREQLEGRAERGAIPTIQLTDNERLIIDRRIRLRSAERDAQEASIDLSLFVRDELGNTAPPSRDRLPADFPPERTWDEAQLRADVERALDEHPVLRELRLRRSELETRYALERNALLPDLRLKLEGSKDLGQSSGGIDSNGKFSDDPKDETELKALLRLELPVLQRRARGRVIALRAEIRRLDLETRLARDRIEAEIRGAMAALSAAFDQTLLARENLELAHQLERAEVRKLTLGSSDLIDVNIREVQAADAARALIYAQAAYFRSVARYLAASGRTAAP